MFHFSMPRKRQKTFGSTYSFFFDNTVNVYFKLQIGIWREIEQLI